MEEAAKVTKPNSVSATERLSSLSGGGRIPDLRDPTRRRGRLLASMLPGQVSEPFEPSEESISTLAEMGFGRDHALEALETVGKSEIESISSSITSYQNSSFAPL